ncbi:MAG: histidine kinase dimerization/phosphoacceptor domain -containing protein [Candidatus Latescibacterota bacterium]
MRVPFFHALSVRRKLTVIITLVASIALLLACAAVVSWDWYLSKNSLVRRLGTLAEIIGSNSTAALSFDSAQDAIETLSALRIEPHITSACIYAADGRPFARYQREDREFAPPPIRPDGHRFEGDHLVYFHSIVLEGDRIGTVYLQADLQEIRSRLKSYAAIVLGFVLASMLVAYLVGSRLQEVISSPIGRLTNAMRQVSREKNYSIRVVRESEDELGVLIDGFNAMLTQIQDRDAALRQARDELARRAQELQLELIERRRIEEQIQASLQEKEVLLKEIHHRVKNNLQVISSLLDLQAGHTHDPRVIEMFRDSQNRVSSMGLIHERLYQADDLARVDFSEYIRGLVNNLFYSYSADAAAIALEIHVAQVVLDVDRGIPCGLIINELVSNSLKYAFPSGRQGCLQVHMRHQGDSLVLVVADDGVGIPEEIDLEHTTSLGLRLVGTLVRQLKGSLTMNRKEGTRFTIEFPV